MPFTQYMPQQWAIIRSHVSRNFLRGEDEAQKIRPLCSSQQLLMYPNMVSRLGRVYPATNPSWAGYGSVRDRLKRMRSTFPKEILRIQYHWLPDKGPDLRYSQARGYCEEQHRPGKPLLEVYFQPADITLVC
jgi:hypothetical protein